MSRLASLPPGVAPGCLALAPIRMPLAGRPLGHSTVPCRRPLASKVRHVHGGPGKVATCAEPDESVLCTALPDPKDPSVVICNATRYNITATISLGSEKETPASTRKYSIPPGSCFSTSDTTHAVNIERPYPANQLKLTDKEAAEASSSSPRFWAVTEEAGSSQVRLSSSTQHPFCWHVSNGSDSYDVRDQATVEAWQHDAYGRREGVKHITRLCSEAAAAASPSSTDSDSDAPTNGSGGSQTSAASMPSTPLSRLLAVLRSLPASYSEADFAYVPLLTTLKQLMAAPLPPAQLQEVARILISKGLGRTCPALVAAANPPDTVA